jgi:hypothetical protein
MARIAAGFRQIVVDLEDCPAMDSTFMGTLTAIAVRLIEFPGGRLQVVNPNERNRSLLSNLGLDQIFDVDTEGITWPREREFVSRMIADDICAHGGPVAKREQCECMISAHEALAEADAANAPRFQDVIECLKREMQALPA